MALDLMNVTGTGFDALKNSVANLVGKSVGLDANAIGAVILGGAVILLGLNVHKFAGFAKLALMGLGGLIILKGLGII